MAGGKVSGAAVRNDPPDPDDYGEVVRVVGVVTVIPPPGTLQPGTETLVTSLIAVMLLPANPIRLGVIIQNNGGGNIRVGPAGVTATSGIRLMPNAILTATPPTIPINELWAIAEGVSSTAFAAELLP